MKFLELIVRIHYPQTDDDLESFKSEQFHFENGLNLSFIKDKIYKSKFEPLKFK